MKINQALFMIFITSINSFSNKEINQIHQELQATLSSNEFMPIIDLIKISMKNEIFFSDLGFIGGSSQIEFMNYYENNDRLKIRLPVLFELFQGVPIKGILNIVISETIHENLENYLQNYASLMTNPDDRQITEDIKDPPIPVNAQKYPNFLMKKITYFDFTQHYEKMKEAKLSSGRNPAQINSVTQFLASLYRALNINVRLGDGIKGQNFSLSFSITQFSKFNLTSLKLKDTLAEGSDKKSVKNLEKENLLEIVENFVGLFQGLARIHRSGFFHGNLSEKNLKFSIGSEEINIFLDDLDHLQTFQDLVNLGQVMSTGMLDDLEQLSTNPKDMFFRTEYTGVKFELKNLMVRDRIGNFDLMQYKANECAFVRSLGDPKYTVFLPSFSRDLLAQRFRRQTEDWKQIIPIKSNFTEETKVMLFIMMFTLENNAEFLNKKNADSLSQTLASWSEKSNKTSLEIESALRKMYKIDHQVDETDQELIRLFAKMNMRQKRRKLDDQNNKNIL